MMPLLETPSQLHWGSLDLPLFGCCQDWFGQALDPPAAWCLAQDPSHLWLIASRSKPALCHPEGRGGAFQAELWKYDVAELFLASPDRSRYLELNLAPNGAWWTCLFGAPRQPLGGALLPPSGLRTHADVDSAGEWVAAAAIPLDWLVEVLGFSQNSPLNVTFILDSPHQRFLSAAPPPEGPPDFHRPDCFVVPRRILASTSPAPMS